MYVTLQKLYVINFSKLKERYKIIFLLDLFLLSNKRKKLIYGCSASNDYDLQAIESIAEYWLGSIATGKRDFELAKLKYRIPGAFCTSAPKIGNMQQALESIPAYQLEAPEACHILPSPLETVLGDDVFILTRLNRLIDAMPPSSTNLKLFDRPLTPFDSNLNQLLKYDIILAFHKNNSHRSDSCTNQHEFE